LNAFRPKIYQTTKDEPRHQRIADEMLRLSKETINPIAQRVEKGPLSSRGRKWEEIKLAKPEGDEYQLNDPRNEAIFFPLVSEREIEDTISFGTYQIAQAHHYAEEEINSKDGFIFYVNHSAGDLIRVRIQSRHKNSTKYFVWLQFKKRDPLIKADKGKITGWYCQCRGWLDAVPTL